MAIYCLQSPPIDPNYQMEAFLEYVNAAPLPLNSKPNVSNMVVKSLTLGIVKAGRRIQHLRSDSPGQESDDSELTEETEEEMEAEEGEEEEEEGQVPDLDDQDWMSACCSEEAVSFFSALATTVGSTGVEVEKLCSETAPPLPTSLPVSLPVSQPLSPSCSLPPAADIVYSAPPPLQSQPYQQVKFQYLFVKLEK